MGDELGAGAHGRAVRLERLQRVPMREQQCELQGGGAGIVCSPAGGDGVAIPRHGQWMNREEDQPVRRAQGADHRTVVTFEAESHRVAVAPRPQWGAPRVASLGRVLTLAALSCCSASRLAASIMCGLRPVEANKSSTGVV